jgi:hypothetical protein
MPLEGLLFIGNYLNQDLVSSLFMVRANLSDRLKPDIAIITIALLGLVIIFLWVAFWS